MSQPTNHDILHAIEHLTEIVLSHEKRFDQIDRRLDTYSKRLEAHDLRFNEHDRRFDAHDKRFDEHDRRFDEHDRRFDEHDKRFDELCALIETLTETVNDFASNTETRLARLEKAFDQSFARLSTFATKDFVEERLIKSKGDLVAFIKARTAH